MSGWMLRAFHSLPYPARVAAAGVWGYRLRRWRYGGGTDLLTEQALERDRWSTDRWTAWREERLAFVLHRAATRVPFYRDQWAERRRRGDRASWEELRNWPVLDKDEVRRAPQRFVADDRDPSRMYHEHTSGTTGKALDLWWSRETVQHWYALFEARWRRWYGVTRHDRWANCGGQLVAPAERRSPPFWVWNAPLRQLYLSSYHLAPDLVPHYVDAMRRHEVRYLWGYTSSLAALAREVTRAGLEPPAMATAVANAEPVGAADRETVAAAFGVPLRETYGMAEIVAAAGECDGGRLHLWPEAGHVEVLTRGGDAAPVGVTGDLVCTGLLNADMPLVRYRVGDSGALGADVTPCACGRRLPSLAHVEGRTDDVVYTRDGRRVGRLDPVFKRRLPVSEAQIVQERLDRVRVRYVADASFTDADARDIRTRLRDRLGDVEVVLEAVPELRRGANGKLRAVVCALSDEERRRVGAR